MVSSVYLPGVTIIVLLVLYIADPIFYIEHIVLPRGSFMIAFVGAAQRTYRRGGEYRRLKPTGSLIEPIVRDDL